MKEKKWTSDVDPQTKAERYGISSLTDAELLALVLRSGTREKNALDLSHELLSGGEGFYRLMEVSREELLSIGGIGKAKAFLLLAVQQIVKRAFSQQRREAVVIESPQQAADYVMQELRYEKQENVVMLLLDARLRIIAKETLFIGTIDQAMYSPRELFSAAMRHSAAQVILFHNHPSGDPTPSDRDIEITRKTEEAGKLLDIPLSDHIIIGDLRYYSFREHGMLS